VHISKVKKSSKVDVVVMLTAAVLNGCAANKILLSVAHTQQEPATALNTALHHLQGRLLEPPPAHDML